MFVETEEYQEMKMTKTKRKEEKQYDDIDSQFKTPKQPISLKKMTQSVI